MDIKKPQLVKVGAFAYFFEGVLQHPRKPATYMRERMRYIAMARISPMTRVVSVMSITLPSMMTRVFTSTTASCPSPRLSLSGKARISCAPRAVRQLSMNMVSPKFPIPIRIMSQPIASL